MKTCKNLFKKIIFLLVLIVAPVIIANYLLDLQYYSQNKQQIEAIQATEGTIIKFGARKNFCFDTTHHASSKSIECSESKLGNLDSGLNAFNHSAEMTPIILNLKRQFNIKTAIETGTLHGSTTALFASIFDNVHSIEIDKENYKYASAKLKDFKNITLHHGSSDAELAAILPLYSDQNILFYLDAHWYNDWPILNELEVIAKTHKNRAIIMIDDVKVYGLNEDISYDSYHNHDLDFHFIENKIGEIYSNYKVYYLIPIDNHNRAKMLIVPNYIG